MQDAQSDASCANYRRPVYGPVLHTNIKTYVLSEQQCVINVNWVRRVDEHSLKPPSTTKLKALDGHCAKVPAECSVVDQHNILLRNEGIYNVRHREHSPNRRNNRNEQRSL
eukprot:1176125-Prorocentrum_minimum.AAC.3